METKNSIRKHAVIAGICVSTSYSLIAFSQHSFLSLLTQICNFGEFWNPIFWRILFPAFIILFFGKTAVKIDYSLNQISYFKACIKFSFAVTLKITLLLITIFIVGLLINGISSVLHWQIEQQLIFSLATIVSLSFLFLILTFLSSLIIIKLNQNPQTLNSTRNK